MPPGPLRLLCHTSFSGWPPGLCPPLTDQRMARTPTGTLPEGQAAPPTHPHVTGCHLSPFSRPPPSDNCSFLPLWLPPPLSSEARIPRVPRTSTWPSLSLTLQPGHAALLVSSPCLAGNPSSAASTCHLPSPSLSLDRMLTPLRVAICCPPSPPPSLNFHTHTGGVLSVHETGAPGVLHQKCANGCSQKSGSCPRSRATQRHLCWRPLEPNITPSFLGAKSRTWT